MDPDDEFTKTKALLGQYFDKDKCHRYEMEGIIAAGLSGIAWLVRYTGEGRPRANDSRIVLKIGLKAARKIEQDADEDENATIETRVGSIAHEGKMLEILRYARHIVKPISPENDPLRRRFKRLRPLHMQLGEWLYMEYLEKFVRIPLRVDEIKRVTSYGSGTLGRFIARATNDTIVPHPLPNRLLWHIFLCLARMGCAFIWPPASGGTEFPSPDMSQQAWINLDLHAGNGMLIVEPSSLIHTAANNSRAILINNPQEAAAEMVYQAGLLMYGIIIEHPRPQAAAADPRSLDNTAFGTIQLFPNQDPLQTIQTCAVRLVPDNRGRSPFPTLEDELVILVCRCMARNMLERPTLAESMQGLIMVNRRGQPYNTRLNAARASRESDENISLIVQRLIFDA
ncbi:hypothetical protein F5Y18DRAFT_443944 [Xylariaceae sp. FL1019]|nr:hypothetical protein F5Y18DRAFT_443944 [Xylariaceae sp. FL1019]